MKKLTASIICLAMLLSLTGYATLTSVSSASSAPYSAQLAIFAANGAAINSDGDEVRKVYYWMDGEYRNSVIDPDFWPHPSFEDLKQGTGVFLEFNSKNEINGLQTVFKFDYPSGGASLKSPRIIGGNGLAITESNPYTMDSKNKIYAGRLIYNLNGKIHLAAWGYNNNISYTNSFEVPARANVYVYDPLANSKERIAVGSISDADERADRIVLTNPRPGAVNNPNRKDGRLVTLAYVDDETKFGVGQEGEIDALLNHAIIREYDNGVMEVLIIKSGVVGMVTEGLWPEELPVSPTPTPTRTPALTPTPTPKPDTNYEEVYSLVNGKRIEVDRTEYNYRDGGYLGKFSPNDKIEFVIKNSESVILGFNIEGQLVNNFEHQVVNFDEGENKRDLSYKLPVLKPGGYLIRLKARDKNGSVKIVEWYLQISATVDNDIDPTPKPTQKPTPRPTPSGKWFSDVQEDYWAYDYIRTLTDKGAVDGYPDGTFRPENWVTRSEFAKMMYLALELHRIHDYSGVITEQPFFVDVFSDTWDYMYVKYVSRYMTGFKAQDGSVYFKGDDIAVREDIAVALVKSLSLENENADEHELKSIFSDWEDISPNLRKYVLIAHKNGLVYGYTDGTYKAQDTITRAETAAMLIRVLRSDAMQKITFE